MIANIIGLDSFSFSFCFFLFSFLFSFFCFSFFCLSFFCLSFFLDRKRKNQKKGGGCNTCSVVRTSYFNFKSSLGLGPSRAKVPDVSNPNNIGLNKTLTTISRRNGLSSLPPLITRWQLATHQRSCSRHSRSFSCRTTNPSPLSVSYMSACTTHSALVVAQTGCCPYQPCTPDKTLSSVPRHHWGCDIFPRASLEITVKLIDGLRIH